MRAQGERFGFRETFAYPGSRETLRAFAVFGLLLAALVTIAGQLTFRELSLQVLERRIDLGRLEAERIAEAVTRLGQETGGIDFSRVRSQTAALTNLIHERLASRQFIRHVEVVDRFGIRQLFISNSSVGPDLDTVVPDLSRPETWSPSGEHMVRVPLAGAEGAVVLGVSAQRVLDEMVALRASLRLRVAVAAALALAVLVAGFFYVLHLIRKNRMLEQARQSAARTSYVGLIASGLAHEIRNPLNSMNINLQMLEEDLGELDDPRSQEWAELLELTKVEIKRLEQVMNNFLSYARPPEPRVETRNLNATLRELVRFLEVDFRQNGVELQADFEPLLPAVEIDETQIKQAVMNLLVNARQILPHGGRVDLRTRAGPGGDVLIEVEDNGPGVAPEARERIFEVFYSSRGGGTGLGLPIARQIVERHGGSIELDSEVGRGTRFTIHLPRHQARSAAAGESTR